MINVINSRGKATMDILKFKRDQYDANNNNMKNIHSNHLIFCKYFWLSMIQKLGGGKNGRILILCAADGVLPDPDPSQDHLGWGVKKIVANKEQIRRIVCHLTIVFFFIPFSR